MPLEIAVITGGRADFGLLTNVCILLDKNDGANLTIIATGSHLSKKHGNTINEILEKNFLNVQTIDLEIDGDSSHDINLYISRAISRFSSFFSKNKVDIVLVLGDRYEIFGASIAASIFGIKIAHIHGGEVTEGAFDEFIRHSITKMAVLHFTSHKDYSNRVSKLGEHPSTIFTVGGLGAENIETMKSSLLSKYECENIMGIKFYKRNLFITYHPETNRDDETLNDLNAILNTLSKLHNTGIIFTLPNADTKFNTFIECINNFVNLNPDSRWAFSSIGQFRYFSLLQYVDAVVGNSSSGLLEAPSFKIATINIGDRQKGRILGKSVINISALENEILKAVETIYSTEFSNILKSSLNVYYKPQTAERIVNTILNYDFPNGAKVFYD